MLEMIIYMPMLVEIVVVMTTILISILNSKILNSTKRIMMFSVNKVQNVVTPVLRSLEQARMDTLLVSLVH